MLCLGLHELDRIMSTDHQNGNGTATVKQTEQALRASELSYRRLFEAAQDGILILDVNTGRIDDVNPFLVKLLGFTREEMVGKTVGELSPFRDIENNQAMLKRLQQHGYVRYEDLPLETRDGRHIAVEFVSNVYKAGNKKVIQCNVRDITTRKKSEERLALLSTCVSNLNDIILVTEAEPIDEPGPKIVFVNEAFERITGYTPAECIGRSPRFLQGEKTDRRITAEIHQALAKGQPIKRQAINYKKDGTEYWMDIDIVPVLNTAGKCTHFVAIERDITESKGLKESLKLFRALMERSPDAIEVIDPTTGQFLDINQTAHERLGYSREEMLSLSLSDIVAHEEGPLSIRDAAEEVQKAGFRIVQSRHRRKDGSTFPVEINVQHIDLGSGYMVAVVRDITDRCQMEERLRESEVKFRTLFEVANDANFILYNGLFVDCNARALELLGATRDQLIGQCPSLFSPAIQPDGDNSLIKATGYIQEAMAGHPQFFEWVHQRLDGVAVYSDISLNRFELDGKIYVQGVVRDITSRKEAEKQLLWKTAFFEAQVDSSLDGILIFDAEGKKVLQNQRMIDLWNIPREFADEVDDRRQFEWVMNQIENPQLFAEKVGYLNSHPDEISRDEIDLLNGKCFDRYSAPVLSKEGTYFGRIWTFRDMTEQKRMESRFRRLVDSNAQSVFFYQRSGEVKGANDAFLKLVGYTREDLKAGRLNWMTMTPTEYAERERAILEILDATGVCGPYEKEYIRKDGSRVPILLGTAAFLDNPDEGVVFVVDLTERKRAEEQIAEQASFLDKAQDAIFVRDLEGKLLFWNKGAERMYGWARQEVVGRNMDEFLYTQPEKLKEAYELTISEGEWHGELQHFTKNQSELSIESRWTLIRDSEGHPKSVLAINTDITEKKKIEAQFLRAQRMESIGTLAGGIAHDLNNILAPILMSIDVLKLRATDPQAKSILETIEVSAKRGADVVRQVLSFARGLEGERVEIQPKHLFKDVESIIRDTFPKDIRLRFSIPEDIWLILGDPTQVHQILLNLCVNARDAMSNGGSLNLSVENCVLDEHYVAMHTQAKVGRYVQISVADTGTGIPPNLIDKIFEPFFTTKDINKGTGLGLSTVMAIVKSHDGIINVYSELGKGTTFKVYLPAMEASVEARKEQMVQASLPRGNGETILLVDDEASILTITSQTLQAYGYRVLTAADGAEAVAVYAQHRHEIAVVLTDMMMPILDGAATIHALTKMNPSIKIIAASGLNTNGSEARISGTVVKHFLAKPYTAGTLLKILRMILGEP